MQIASFEKLDDKGIVIRQDAPLIARLFGVPFLAVGIWFFWQFLVVLGEALRPSLIIDFGSSIPSLLLLLAMAVAFSIPGVLLVLFRRKNTIIRPEEHSVIEQRDFLLFKVQKGSAVDNHSVVEIRREQSKDRSGSTVWFYCVYLDSPSRQKASLAVLKTAEEARQLGDQISKLLGISVHDQIEPDEHTGEAAELKEKDGDSA